MSYQINQSDNISNQKNPNKGTLGTNMQYDQVHGNRGKQMNPNQKNPNKNVDITPNASDTPEQRMSKAKIWLLLDASTAFELFPELHDEYNEDDYL